MGRDDSTPRLTEQCAHIPHRQEYGQREQEHNCGQSHNQDGLDQGREVFAIPGSIHNPIAKGCHRLIRQGAKLVDSATHILEELGPLAATLISAEPSNSTVRGGISTDFSDDPEYAKLLQALGYDPVPLDALKDSTGLTAEQLSSMLLILELEGVVESSPGGAYSRVIKEAEKQ